MRMFEKKAGVMVMGTMTEVRCSMNPGLSFASRANGHNRYEKGKAVVMNVSNSA